jgi:hypothetical protein
VVIDFEFRELKRRAKYQGVGGAGFMVDPRHPRPQNNNVPEFPPTYNIRDELPRDEFGLILPSDGSLIWNKTTKIEKASKNIFYIFFIYFFFIFIKLTVEITGVCGSMKRRGREEDFFFFVCWWYFITLLKNISTVSCLIAKLFLQVGGRRGRRGGRDRSRFFLRGWERCECFRRFWLCGRFTV